MFWLFSLFVLIQSYDEVLERGVAALEKRQFPEAEAAFREALELAPEQAVPRLLLGQVLLSTNRPLLALQSVERLDDDGAVRCLRGRALLDLGRYRDAASELEFAVAALGDERVCRESLALASIEIGDAERALAALEPLVSRDRTPALDTTYGIALALADRHEEAVAFLRAALSVEPRRALALFYLARSLQLLDRCQEAIEVYRRGIDFPPPENIRFELGLARCRIRLGQLVEAREELEGLVTRHPRVGRAWLLRGVVAFDQGRYDDSIEDVRNAVEHGYNAAESDLRLGMALGMLAEYDRGLAALDTAIEKEPDLAVAYYYKGLFLFRQGEEMEGTNPFGILSLRLLQRSNALLPNPRTSLTMADAYLKLGQHLRAIDAASQATSVPELAPEAYHRIALAHHELLEYPAAEQSYRRAFEAGADTVEVHHDFGNLLSVMGRWDEARDALEKALVLAPDYFGAHLQLGIAYGNLHQDEKAHNHLERAVAHEPDSSEAWYQKGLVESRAGGAEAAVASWRKALELDPNDTRSLYRLGSELLKLGRTVERNALLVKFQERQRDEEARYQRDERLSNLLTAAFKAQDEGDEATARSLLDEARAIAPDDPRPYVYLADLHLSKRRFTEARAVLREGLERLPLDLSLRQMLVVVESELQSRPLSPEK